MATRRQLALVRTLRRLTNQETKVLRRVLRNYVNSEQSKIATLALTSNWSGIDKIFENLAIKLKPVLTMIFCQSANTASRVLGVKVKKVDEFEIDDLAELLGPEISFDIYNPRIIAYLETHGLELSKTVADSLKKACQDALAKGYELGESIPHLSKRLAETLEGFTKDRLEMIARSETLRASNQGALEGYIQAGVERKCWMATEGERTCEECEALDGICVGVHDTFPGGYDFPPAHPDCRCCIAPGI